MKSFGVDFIEEEVCKNCGDVVVCIICVEFICDLLWVGIVSGYILIFDLEIGYLFMWFYFFDEMWIFILINGFGLCGIE